MSNVVEKSRFNADVRMTLADILKASLGSDFHKINEGVISQSELVSQLSEYKDEWFENAAFTQSSTVVRELELVPSSYIKECDSQYVHQPLSLNGYLDLLCAMNQSTVEAYRAYLIDMYKLFTQEISQLFHVNDRGTGITNEDVIVRINQWIKTPIS